MRRLSIGMSLAAAAAAMAIGTTNLMGQPALRPSAPKITNEQRRHRSKRKKGPAPAARSAQDPAQARLIVDRSSSFKKLRRWARVLPGDLRQPDTKALERHGWYRRAQRKATALKLAA